MGARGAYETVAAVVLAFTREHTLTQAGLARQLGISTARLRKVLLALREGGMPLEAEREHPHIYWSVPNGWFPGTARLSRERVADLLSLLIRLPDTPARQRVLECLTALPIALRGAREVGQGVQHRGARGLEQDEVWRLASEAIRLRRPLRIGYASAHSAARSRTISPQRIDHGRAVHLIAICHESGTLKRFHFGRIHHIDIDPYEQYRSADAADLERATSESVDGFRGPGDPIAVAFVVQSDAASWVVDDLPSGLVGEPQDDGTLRVTGTVAGLSQVARYVVGLGSATHVETPALREAVLSLARDALLAHQLSPSGADDLSIRSVRSNRTTDCDGGGC